MEESFVLLQNNYPARQGAGGGGIPQRLQFYNSTQVLARVLELASEAARVDMPLCPDCAGEVQRELEAQIKDLEEEAERYAALEERLKAEEAAGELTPMDPRTFQQEVRRAQEELKAEE